MRRTMWNNLLLGTVCVFGVVVAASAQDGGAIDPAARFDVVWESVHLEAYLYNPDQRPNEAAGTQRELVVRGNMGILDETDLIGIDTGEEDLLVLDQDGAELYNAVGMGIGLRHYRSLENVKRFSGFGEPANEFSLSLNVPLDPNASYPTSLGRIEWTTNILLAGGVQAVDVPFEPNETWIELVPGVEIEVQKATVSDGRYDYTIEFAYDPNLVDFPARSSWTFWNEDVPAPTMLIDMDLLNAAGQSVRELGGSGSWGTSSHASGSEDGMRLGTATGYGRCSACGDVTTIRYTFALAPYEQAARLALENVPVPNF